MRKIKRKDGEVLNVTGRSVWEIMLKLGLLGIPWLGFQIETFCPDPNFQLWNIVAEIYIFHPTFLSKNYFHFHLRAIWDYSLFSRFFLLKCNLVTLCVHNEIREATVLYYKRLDLESILHCLFWMIFAYFLYMEGIRWLERPSEDVGRVINTLSKFLHYGTFLGMLVCN